MTLHVDALTFDAHDPDTLARFWAGLIGWTVAPDSRDGVTTTPPPDDDTGFRLRFVASDEVKSHQNHVHFDLKPETAAQQQEAVDRALALGASHLDVGQGPDAEHVVLADPEGNELCVLEPGNNFLAECGFVGALACDGSHATGVFWSEALGWPLVWDEGEETAIRSPQGGPKITWGGPPLGPWTGKHRLHWDLVADDVETEVRRLLGLGATRADIGQGDVPWVVLRDPDGHELCVHPAG